jgi:hypothetical protein
METSMVNEGAVDETQDLIKREEVSRKSMSLVLMIYLLFFTTNLFVNIDHGVMPAATLQMR